MAQVDAELRATQSVLQCAEIDRAIELMLEANDDLAVVQTAAALLTKLLGNAVSDPSNDKFRRIKKDNKHIASKVIYLCPAVASFPLSVRVCGAWVEGVAVCFSYSASLPL